MALDPQTQTLLDEVNALDATPAWELPLWKARAGFEALTLTWAPERLVVPCVESLGIPGPHGSIPLRIYWPEAVDAGGAPPPPLPVFVHFHGSGFVVLGLNSHDHACRSLCRRAHCIVVAVDYRKAPENKFPKPTDDAWAATRWVANNCAALGGDPARIAVGGDSAGGCLAAVVTQRAKAEGGPALAFQLLVYPVTDMRDDTGSYQSFAEGYLLTADSMRWFMRCYLNDESEKADPVAAPLLAEDLSGLPPALVLVAGYDPLFDEGIAYAEKLKAAGVPVTLRNYEDQIHGFWTMGGRVDAATGAQAEASAALWQAFETHNQNL